LCVRGSRRLGGPWPGCLFQWDLLNDASRPCRRHQYAYTGAGAACGAVWGMAIVPARGWCGSCRNVAAICLATREPSADAIPHATDLCVPGVAEVSVGGVGELGPRRLGGMPGRARSSRAVAGRRLSECQRRRPGCPAPFAGRLLPAAGRVSPGSRDSATAAPGGWA